MNIICFGASTTQAVNFPEGDRWPTVLQCKLDRWRPGGFKVYNRGIGGNTSSQGVDRLAEEVFPLLPGLVIFQFGFNDSSHGSWQHVPRVGPAQYAANMAEMTRAIRERGGRTLHLVNHTVNPPADPQGNGKLYVENLAPYLDAARDIAGRLNAPLLDLPAVMARREVDLGEFLAADGVHLSTRGNHLYADMVFEALQDIL